MAGARLGAVPLLVRGRRLPAIGPDDLGGRGGLDVLVGGGWKLAGRDASDARCEGLWLSYGEDGLIARLSRFTFDRLSILLRLESMKNVLFASIEARGLCSLGTERFSAGRG